MSKYDDVLSRQLKHLYTSSNAESAYKTFRRLCRAFRLEEDFEIGKYINSEEIAAHMTIYCEIKTVRDLMHNTLVSIMFSGVNVGGE